MQTEAKFADPSNLQVTVTLSASLAQFELLIEQLKPTDFYGPVQELRETLRSVAGALRTATKSESPKPTDDD